MSIYTAPATSATIVDGSIVDADVNASAAIAGTKISPNFGSQNVVTTGTSTAASLIPTGSGVPTNGMYLPSANNLSFSTSSTQRMLVDSSGRLLVGTSTARTGDGVTPRYFQEGTSTYEAIGVCTNDSTTANRGAYLFLSRSRGTTNGSSTIVANGDTIGSINFYGADGTDIDTAAAYISCAVDGTPGLNDMPGRLVFSTTADGAASPTEAMRINNQRELLIGTTTRTANGGVLQVSNGITFPGTQSACSDPNTLDDYEEGTWTVTFYDANTAGNASSTTATGDYTKVGNTVRATFSIDNINTTGLTAGNIFRFTLPFTHAGTYESAGSCAFASVTLGAGYTGLTSFIPANATRGYFLVWGNNIAFGNAPVSYFNNGAADLRVTITYKAA